VAEAVLDASVVLALIQGERLQDSVHDILDGAVMSAVNLAEVLTRLTDVGMITSPATRALLRLLGRIEPFSAPRAYASAALRPQTTHLGLSLGDRACLALALELDADVYTCDRAWLKTSLGCRIHIIR
jgi:PIN domain nuclease of toxin-antitoxin system